MGAISDDDVAGIRNILQYQMNSRFILGNRQLPLRSRKMVPVALITRLEMRLIFGVAFQITRYVCCLPQLVGTYYTYLTATTRHYSSIQRPRTSSRPPALSEAPQRSAPKLILPVSTIRRGQEILLTLA